MSLTNILPLISLDESERMFELAPSEIGNMFKHKSIFNDRIIVSITKQQCTGEICCCHDSAKVTQRDVGAIMCVKFHNGIVKFVYQYINSIYCSFSYKDGICIQQFVVTNKNKLHNTTGPAKIKYYENGNIESIYYYKDGVKININAGGMQLHCVSYLHNGEINEIIQADGTIVSNYTSFKDLWLQHCITPSTMNFAD